jgi:threonine dehydrogenase-like Zn-dependent dehydrogenase
MRQLVFQRPGALDWEEVDDPRLEGDDQAIVRPVAATSCDQSDLDHAAVLADQRSERGTADDAAAD